MQAPGDSENGVEGLVAEIAHAISGQSGQPLLRSMVGSLARALEADSALIGTLRPGGARVQPLAVVVDGVEIAPAEYEVAGTPCGNVVQSRHCSYPLGVQRLFPLANSLAKMGAESYAGAPLLDSAGRCMGLIATAYRRPLLNVKYVDALLRIFASRAEAELERNNQEQRFHAFANRGTEAIFRMELEQPVPLDLAEEDHLHWLYRHAYVAECNDKAARLFGYSCSQDLIGARMNALVPRENNRLVDRVRSGIRSAWQSSEIEREFGGRSYVMTREGIIENGKMSGGWITARDVTEVKELEAETKRLRDELDARVQGHTAPENKPRRSTPMVGASPQFREMVERIHLVAPTSSTVLITGETGVGKELVAHAIHDLSPRRRRPLVKINCAAISAGLVESELFGHVKGAFTGASERRLGRFEYADGGTLFLDEVSELPLESQAKLLRVLQEREFEPVGSNRTVQVDVRTIVATNRRLELAVTEGRFRSDLYYRLMVLPLEVPPLRERREDIPALVAHFTVRLARELGRKLDPIPESWIRRLIAHDWPGNVRELENVLSRAFILSFGRLSSDVLDAALRPTAVSRANDASCTLQEAERRHICAVLASTNWVVEGPAGAAEVLKVRASTLRSRMKRLGISRV